MLYFRNNYKNCKLMILYAALSIVSIIFAAISFLVAFMTNLKVGIILCVIFCCLCIISSFLLVMKNNDYKLKHFFKLGKFNKEFKKFEKLSKGNKKIIKEIKRTQKDYFLQFGDLNEDKLYFQPEKNNWNIWVEDAIAFSYPNAGYIEKLSYLTYLLYNACSNRSGLEEFFKWISYEPFTKEEIIDILTKSEFFNVNLKEFLVKTIKEYDIEKQDELFKKYESDDNNIFFTFDKEIENCSNWLARNRFLLSSCAGIYVHTNTSFNIVKLFLSKDYKKVIFIYTHDDAVYRTSFEKWNYHELIWESSSESNRSIYDSEETALKNIKEKLKDYIEISI